MANQLKGALLSSTGQECGSEDGKKFYSIFSNQQKFSLLYVNRT